jgi:RNA polymerase sigma factor (sigma-70 family)
VRDQTHITDQRVLLAAAKAGDERAFSDLVEPYTHALEVHCYRMLGSVQDAEDRVQETLLRAWRALGRFEPRAQVQTWLYRIATNACLDELERRPRRPEPVDPFPDALADQAAAPTYDPVARYAIREGMELAGLHTGSACFASSTARSSRSRRFCNPGCCLGSRPPSSPTDTLEFGVGIRLP